MAKKISAPFLLRRIHGHSMMPTLPPGTLVFGLRWFTRLKPGKVVIFKREGREIIKRIESIDSDGLFVVGDHSDASTDSRHYGQIPRGSAEAVIIWPRC